MLRPLWRPRRGPYNGLNNAIFEIFYKVAFTWPLHGLYTPHSGLFYMAFTWPLHGLYTPQSGLYMALTWPLHGLLHGLYTPQSGFTVAFYMAFTGALQNSTKRPLPNNS